MAIIPRDKEAEALRMHAAGVDVAEIHRFCWPGGSSVVSHGTLRTVLSATVAAELRAEPSDELPTDLDEALSDIVEARGRLMDALRAEVPEGGEETGTNVGIHLALVANVKAHISASKHRITLQAHRAHMEELTGIRSRSCLATRRDAS